jgi:hypothetical protein
MPVCNKEDLLDFFLAYLNKAAESGEEMFAEVFYKETRDKFVLQDEVSNRDLWELLKKVGKAFRLIPNNTLNGHFSPQRLMVKERMTRWLDAGMISYRDQNGNDPLADKDSRVSTFTVASFQTLEDSFKGTAPVFNKGQVTR